MATLDELTDVPRRRPKHRKAQILASACELIVAQGYDHVSMAMIADRVGITAGALYRHFENKAVLLESVCADAFSYLDDHVVGDSFDAMIEDAIAKTEGRSVAELWSHEVRHLPVAQQAALRDRMRSWTQAFQPPIREHRPALDDGQADLLAWTVQSLLAGLGSPANNVARERRVSGVRRAIRSVLDVDLEPTGPVREQSGNPILPASMRERLLLAAIDQFGRGGFQDTSMASIGASVDVSGQNLYGYFASKADILKAVLERGIHTAWIGYDAALQGAESQEEAVRRALHAHVGLARTWTDVRVPPTTLNEFAEQFAAAQREYRNEWVALISRIAPDLDAQDLRMRVRFAFSLISDLNRTPHLASRASFESNLVLLAEAVLTG